MVKSASCFKIITCGSDSVEKDDVRVSEGKNSCDKRRWSFRKRSARHRVLSNNVSTEALTTGNKEVPESSPLNFEPQNDIIAQEKISVVNCVDEKPQLPTVVKLEVPDTVVKEEEPEEVPDTVAVTEEVPEVLSKTEMSDSVVTVENDCDDAKIKESAVIAIQSAVRNFLALRELQKLKKLVKLQAAVRGHIVRRHAVGTIRCVQAIVKMQALVRARHARVSSGKNEEDFVKKPIGGNTSFEKLLSNRFARQMLESTPKTKPIHVKCDPSKPDSAWKWLERWMSVSADSKKVVSVTEEEKLDTQLVTETESEVICEPTDSKCYSLPESIAPSESEDNLITYEADKFDFQGSRHTTTSTKDDLENTSTSGVRETPEDVDSLHTHSTQFHKYSEPEKEAEEPKELEKATNPSYDDSQSKFEEFNSIDELHDDTSFEVQPVNKQKEVSQIGGSECGTELSVTSTLDSPDRSEIGGIEHAPEPKVVEDGNKCVKDSESEKADVVKSESAVPEMFPLADLTPETPRSFMTGPESQRTPSSEVSVKERKKKGATKKSPKTDSGKERAPKNGKRRNSRNGDQEPRDCSNNLIPHFMQATQSARAKLSSPRSSPDVHNGDNFVKKRLSLPAANGSPRVERSPTQPQPPTRGTGTERKWQR